MHRSGGQKDIRTLAHDQTSTRLCFFLLLIFIDKFLFCLRTACRVVTHYPIVLYRIVNATVTVNCLQTTLDIHRLWASTSRRGQSRQYDSQGCARRSVLLRVGRRVLSDVVEGRRVSLGDVGQRWRAVWNVDAEQDAERRRVKSPLYSVVLSWLCVDVPGRQLLDVDETLRAVLLRAMFLRRATGLRQLSGIVSTYSTASGLSCGTVTHTLRYDARNTVSRAASSAFVIMEKWSWIHRLYSDQDQNVTPSRSSPPAHIYRVNELVTYLADRRTHTHIHTHGWLITIPSPPRWAYRGGQV